MKDTKETPRGYRGKQLREWSEGKSKQQGRSKAIPFAALAGARPIELYHNLKSKEARQGFFDSLLQSTTSATVNWAEFYALVQVMRESEWYWKGAGFDTFEEFWHETVGDAFATLQDLEAVYNFAKLADPALFNTDFDTASKVSTAVNEQLKHLAGIPAAKPHGGLRGNRHTSKEEANTRVAEAAGYKRLGGNALERTFATLRRDNPEVAAKVLGGEYTKEISKGIWGVDMKAAYKDAGITSNSEKQKARKEKRQKQSDMDVLKGLLKTRSKVRRELLVKMISECKWLMEELTNES